MKDIIHFLSELYLHNEKPWFDAHKEQYLAVSATFNTFAQQLISGVASFDASVKNVTLKDCTYRIYRDLRFSPDKTPYKTHMGVYICPFGKKSSYAGYYFHVEPMGQHYLNGPLVACGLHCPTPDILKSVREDIMCNGAAYQEAVQAAPNLTLSFDGALKRVPRGLPADSPYAPYFTLKDHLLCRDLDYSFIFDKNLLDNTLQLFREAYPYVTLLNRSVSYAYTEKI